MSQSLKLRLSTSVAFAALVVIAGWLISALLLSYGRLGGTMAITLAIGAGTWAYIVNNLEADQPKRYATIVVQHRPLLLSFGIFIALVVLWIIGRAVAEWSVEPNITDYGPCGRFNYGPCGEQDLNSGRRYLATDLIDKIFGGIFLIAPLALASGKVRTAFQ